MNSGLSPIETDADAERAWNSALSGEQTDDKSRNWAREVAQRRTALDAEMESRTNATE